MKTTLLTAALVAGFAWAHAQEPAASNGLSTTGTALSMPVEQGSLFPSAGASGLIVSPSTEVPTPTPAESQPEAPAAAGTPAVSTPPPAPEMAKGSIEQLRQAVRIRELKTLVLEDPEVQAQKEGAQCAQTEEGRRIWMRNYYTLIYTKIEKLDPSLETELEAQLHDILSRYEQHKVRPSVLIECVKELPGSHSADHLAGKSAGKEDKSSKKKAKIPH